MRELQELCGFLNFLNKAIYPGRVFTRRMYAQYSKIVQIKPRVEMETSIEQQIQGKSLKQHHHVRLNKEFKLDCQVWLKFLTYEDKRLVVNKSMVDSLESVSAKQIFFYSDASAAENLGFGCILNQNCL